MTDRELLELAAKAVRCTITWEDWEEGGTGPYLWGFTPGDERGEWNPLTDDGDALRLAVKLGIYFMVVEEENTVCTKIRNGVRTAWIEPIGVDPYAATRRAIVRAAAEIGKAMT